MLAQAASVSSSLLEQRRVFDSVQDKLMSVGERFPAVNGLLNAIRRKKSKVRLAARGCAARACAGSEGLRMVVRVVLMRWVTGVLRMLPRG